MVALSYKEVPFLFTVSRTSEDIKGACEAASRHRLAVPGWVFFELFRDGKNEDFSEYQIMKISMCYCNVTGDPIGCAVMFQAWGDVNAGCFVRDSHRRQRIGSRLVEELLAGEATPVRIHDGIKGSKNFWQCMGANDMDYIRDR